jgi:solute:Na+ symporter, SSS family
MIAVSLPPLFAAAAPSGLVSLGTVDYLVIAVYFAFVLGIGFYLKHFANTGAEFFLAGREMTAWIAGLAFISGRALMLILGIFYTLKFWPRK